MSGNSPDLIIETNLHISTTCGKVLLTSEGNNNFSLYISDWKMVKHLSSLMSFPGVSGCMKSFFSFLEKNDYAMEIKVGENAILNLDNSWWGKLKRSLVLIMIKLI